FHCFDNSFVAMADVEAADAAGEVEVAVAVHVFEPGIFGLGNIDGRAVRKAAGHGFGAPLGEGLRFRARNGCAELNSRHLKFSVLGSQLTASGFRVLSGLKTALSFVL